MWETKKKKKNRENACQIKAITRTKQYLHGSTICLHPWSCRDFTIIKEKNIKCGYNIFFSLSRNTTTTNLNLKFAFFTSYAQDSQWATKHAKIFLFFQGALAWACRLKPLLHGLNLRKSPIKNHTTLFKSGVKLDQTKLDSTKPNNYKII